MAMNEEERAILEPYVTNSVGNVFVIKDLPGMIGSVMARYSRAETGLRETLVREFIKAGQINPKKADSLIKRVLIAYGDDSVGELEGAHLSFEDISFLATKVIEHRRIGGSPIEQSTRYVRFDYRDEHGQFRYYQPQFSDPGHGARFCRDMDRIFENYGRMFAVMNGHLERLKPIHEASYPFKGEVKTLADMDSDRGVQNFQRTYANDIKTKACDVLRAFLPLATKANVGLFGNGRYYQNLISKLWTSSLPEANQLGDMAFEELSKVIKQYVRRAKKMAYVEANEAAMRRLAATHFQGLEGQDGITLIQDDYDWMARQLRAASDLDGHRLHKVQQDESMHNFLASLMFAYCRGSFVQIRSRIKTLPNQVHQQILDAYYGQRSTRRDRPERGIEFGYPYNFELVTEWGVYKDLMRHRMGTIMYQDLVPDLGFQMPDEIEATQLTGLAKETVAIAEDLFGFLDRHEPALREYAFLQGHKLRWFLGMNDRALMHMVELRSTPQGHLFYRQAAQQLHRLACTHFPERGARMSFVNHDPIYWARSDSEAKQRDKEDEIDHAD